MDNAIQKLLRCVLCLSFIAVQSPLAYADLPDGANVVHGQVLVNSDGTTMDIQQNSQQAIIDWVQFNIGAGKTVNFNMPGASSVNLSRVISKILPLSRPKLR